MKRSWKWIVAAVVAVALVPAAWSQATTAVKGKVSDESGQPIAGAVIEFLSLETGRKYSIDTNKKGEYYSIGVATGTYKVTFYRNQEDQKAGRPLFFIGNVPVTLSSENLVDLDLAKERAKTGVQMTEEQKKQQEEAQKENVKIKELNEMLKQAAAASEAGAFDQAVEILTKATEAAPTRDLLWFKRGDAHLGAKQYDQAIDSYQRAVAIKPLGAYYNNLGQAQVKSGKVEEAVASFGRAAEIEPTSAGQYYFNLGAVLTNNNRLDDAITAFDKAIAADPTRAESYYWKGVNLIGKATLGKDNRMVAPPGTEEAFNKFLELQPEGQLADAARQMLASIGAEIQTSYKKPKATKKN
ncbi:MAG: tetratricopeptide repeat protein [Acidobacteria bacterium]|nr:tetratricopeptide repeat protein [Acidobacteriota bacterium]